MAKTSPIDQNTDPSIHPAIHLRNALSPGSTTRRRHDHVTLARGDESGCSHSCRQNGGRRRKEDGGIGSDTAKETKITTSKN